LGIPVLPGGRAGLAVLAGPTGGFLLGMIPGAVITGWLAGALPRNQMAHTQQGWQAAAPQVLRCWVASVIGGLLVVYAVGIPWLATVTGMGLNKAAWAVIVFLPGDLLKALVASIVAQRVRRLGMI
jgi:biotin transport system substrate-specific component